MRPQWTIRALVVALIASSLPALALPALAAAGPSVPLPDVRSAPVQPQGMTARAPDPASTNALTGNQTDRTDKDGAGSYGATSLSPTTTWDVSAQTGDFTTSYPLRVPPAPGGLVPNLALGYRSSAVDGRTSVTNNQPSWIGDGWDLAPGFVERAYGSCADDTDGTAPPKTADLCWRSDNATASYGGSGGLLIRDDASGDWHPKNDDGSRVQRLTGAANGDDNGEYWKITTVDGLQYFFGSEADSGSTWTVPVFGDDAEEPCHKATFDTSRCTQAWRWNLDKVVDRNGNLVRYFYEPETNSYGLSMKDAPISYIRGGNLVRAEYGLNQSVNAPATGMVAFTLADRCVPGSDCSQSNKANWPDTPLDRLCSSQTCTKHAPSFFSTKRLTGITTRVRSGSGYADVDRWDFDQQYPDPGDGEKAALWLKGIKHTGLAGGGNLELPSLRFEGNQFPNRVSKVDGISSLNRYRLTGIISETGGITSVTYAAPECKDGGPMPANPETNTLRCFPVRWTRPGEQERTDYFHKYVVAQVVQSDRLSSSTEQVTSYEYLDGAAWHFSQSEFAKVDKKTWDEFRGFGRVRIRSGAEHDPAGPVTMTEHRYYRGMNGDHLPSGTRSVTVTDSEGGSHADEDWLAGIGYETTTFDHAAPSSGPAPPAVSKAISEPSWQGPTATRGPFKAYLVKVGTQRQLTALSSGGWRTTETDTSYDGHGLAVTVNDLGDLDTADDDRCTTTSYAPNTDAWLLNLAARVETVAVACGTRPTFPRDALSDTRTSFDRTGNPIRVEGAKDRPAAGPVYLTTATSTFDVHGRTTSATDAAGNTTRTAYVPATGGPLSSTTVTSPPTAAAPSGMSSTTTVEPAFGQPILVTDQNNLRTELAYDALGRRTKVWLPNRPHETNQDPSLAISYLVRNDAPTVVTVDTIGANGGYTRSSTLFDGLLRQRQTQRPAVGSGRLITDTRYDSQGRTYKQTQPYFNDAAMDDKLWLAADTDVPGLTRTEFDGAGRQVASVYLSSAVEKWRTSTVYGGDRVSVTPPAGGVATTQVSDARGRVTELRQYHGPTPTGAYDSTAYTYDPAGNLTRVTAPGGATWRYGYDLRARRTTMDDPDRGLTTLSYNDLDQLTATRDARGSVIAYTYDTLGRPTSTRADSATGPLLAERTYDTAFHGLGQPATATRFVGTSAYRTSIESYSAGYQPTEITTTIPATEGLLAGTYTSDASYNADGSLSGESYPAAGGLDEEFVNYARDDLGRGLSSSGSYRSTVDLVTGMDYTRYGEPQRMQLGVTGKRAWLSRYYDPSTRRLDRSIVDTETPAPLQSDTRYAYDPAGNVTAIADAPDTQCFRYDYLRRVTQAWTPSGDCTADPNSAALSGPAPYWQSYTYDQNGNRASDTTHTSGGDTVRGYTYPAAGQPQPHTLRSVTAGGVTSAYGYDATGNTVTRGKPGANQSLAWDAEGHLTSVTQNGKTTSYLYGPAGDLLLRKDPSGTTLYLPKQEIRLAASGGSPTATRYYTFDGTTVAARQGGTLTWLAGDQQATAQLAVNTSTLAVSRRRQLPFGAPRGSAPGSWPGERGFVGGVQDPATGLTQLGAREYDPDLGRFLSVDPLMNMGDPQSWNGYGYADDNPATFSDPTGLRIAGCEEYHENCRTGEALPPEAPAPPTSAPPPPPTVTTTGSKPPPASSGTRKPAATTSPPPTKPSGDQAGSYSEWLATMRGPSGGCSAFLAGCALLFLQAVVSGAMGSVAKDASDCVNHDVGACIRIVADGSMPARGITKRTLEAVPGAVKEMGEAATGGVGPLRPPARELAENEGVLITSEQGLQSRTSGTFENVIEGTHGDLGTKYLWTIDQRGINVALEKTPFPTPRGNIVHTNLSSQASIGGEAWFGANRTVTINAGSGRFGDGAGITPGQWDAAVKMWEGLGYQVNAIPFGER